jgi:hypothetical protein
MLAAPTPEVNRFIVGRGELGRTQAQISLVLPNRPIERALQYRLFNPS